MRTKIASVVIVLAAMSLAGCAGRPKSGPVTAQSPLGVAPLTEAEFDRFASRLAEKLVPVLRDGPNGLPIDVAGPSVAEGSAEADELSAEFARTLAGGLNDRLDGAARFRANSQDGAPLHASVTFVPVPGHERRRSVTFTLSDASDGRTLITDTFEYEPPPVLAVRPEKPERAPRGERPTRVAGHSVERPAARAAPSARATAPSEPAREKPTAATAGEPARSAARPSAPPAKRVRKRDIPLDRDERELIHLLVEQFPNYAAQTVGGEDGAVLYVDEKSQRNIRLVQQRAVHAPSDGLRVEASFRSRDKKRDADVRVLFFDASDRFVEATPVLPYYFITGYTTTVVASTTNAAAVGYLVLVEE